MNKFKWDKEKFEKYMIDGKDLNSLLSSYRYVEKVKREKINKLSIINNAKKK
jgi:hypothetical protein